MSDLTEWLIIWQTQYMKGERIIHKFFVLEPTNLDHKPSFESGSVHVLKSILMFSPKFLLYRRIAHIPEFVYKVLFAAMSSFMSISP
jgi:hypothetical protein